MASLGVIGFVGIDKLSLSLAASFVRAGFGIQAFEIEDAGKGLLIDKFVELGGIQRGNGMEAARDTKALILLIDMGQMDVIFGEEGVVKGLQKDTVVIIRSGIPPTDIQMLEKRLSEEAGVTILLDAYIFTGVSESLMGSIIVSASGNKEAMEVASPILSVMAEKHYIFEGEVGVSSKVRLVNELLVGIHLASAVEAIFLGARAGIHPQILYDIISKAAGSSWIFVDIVPKLLNGALSRHYLLTLIEKLESVMDMAKLLKFPLPLLAVARQLLIYGCSCVHLDADDNHDTEPVNVWERTFGINIREAAIAQSYSPRFLADQIVASSSAVKRIGIIGLGAMGFGMAVQLIRSNFCVLGYDVYAPTLSRFADVGGLAGYTPADVSIDVDVLIIMVANEVQAESVLYGVSGSVSALPVGATIILSSTVSPGFVTRLKQHLQEEKKNLKLVDAPVSGGVIRAANGTLTIMASGTEEALKSVGSVLSALSENLYVINGGCGAGSSVKMVNQLLAGVHIATAAEALAFGARLGVNTKSLFEVILNSEGNSWMFGNRAPHMIDNDYTPHSAIDIFVKDLGIVIGESSVLKIPLYVSAVAHQQFLSGSASGWGRLDDAAVVKVYEVLTGVKVEQKVPVLKKSEVMKSLPAEWSEDPLENIQALVKVSKMVLVVLDDDPTGTQTVHDIEVLTEWSVESLIGQFSMKPLCFFILTNSRALSSEKATLLINNICRNIDIAAKSVQNTGYTVVLRGDSTLRGHFPEEADAAISVLGEMDAWIICPFFLQGGRYTIDNVHYVAESDSLVPAGETEFSKDAAFGYKASNLCEWVEEKTKGRISANTVASVSIKLLRKGGPIAVCEYLCSLPKGSTCIVNAASERDMEVFAEGMIHAEIRGKRFLCRTAASFVSTRIGIKSKAPITAKELGINRQKAGGLVVVGSYVPKSTKQVEELKSRLGHAIKCIEVSVDKLSMRSLAVRDREIGQAVEKADSFLRAGKDTLIMTSRDLIKGASPLESLEINSKVSSALVDIVRSITTRPRYILAKGGITSSDLATKALEAKRAQVIGQALAGVPLWQLGPESRHPGVPYIVFPGKYMDFFLKICDNYFCFQNLFFYL
ncbi:hypothetical protein ZOSMA_99G00140 [Zostera marina]|uniref:Ketose-bisphosphate aldolase class-II family protein n=1 Tax=Zostera marina TaxID=29655 RepID=A0A0K9NH56_ZOSMR|nr:hypothetical protein ZOSMA_99G00140 [Zostera marina]